MPGCQLRASHGLSRTAQASGSSCQAMLTSPCWAVQSLCLPELPQCQGMGRMRSEPCSSTLSVVKLIRRQVIYLLALASEGSSKLCIAWRMYPSYSFLPCNRYLNPSAQPVYLQCFHQCLTIFSFGIGSCICIKHGSVVPRHS